MLIPRAVFWIVCVSLLLAGGGGLPGYYGDRPGAEYVDSDSPAYHSAERVVASVSQLNGWCLSHENVCDVAGTAGSMALELIEGVGRWTVSQLKSTTQRIVAVETGGMATSPRRQSAEKVRSDETANVSLFDGITDLLYDEGEELDDIG